MISFFQPTLHQQLCHKDEHLALVQFKDSFVIERHACANPFAYPKVDLWKFQGIDCCSWEGIQCNQYTGHVIALNLSSSCLFGHINSSSSLFRLGHLQYINLAFNDFNYSEIPPALGNLSRLTYLNLSNSFFHGHVPSEISKLSKLVKLDLSFNLDYSYQGLLELKRSDLNSLIHNLTKLEWLDLSLVHINSPIPNALANLSSLICLRLIQCGLFGKFPTSIFQLSKLEYLFVGGNWGLTGSFPEFQFSNPLKVLSVTNTSFSGEFPSSFGLLSSLKHLEVQNCHFSGLLPSSLSNLTDLYFFSLWNNSFKGSEVPFLSNLTQLRHVALGLNQFTFSEIPSFASLIHLHVLDLSYNLVTGQFPSWLANLTQLTWLTLRWNMLEGQLPSSISRLKNLVVFDVGFNNLSGTVEFDTFIRLKHLKALSFSSNTFSLQTKIVTNSTIQKFVELGLGSCNLGGFPNFLRNQDQLWILNLSSNKIHGQIPKWLLKICANLWFLDLHNNFLTSFEESLNVIPSSLLILDLSCNFLIGSLPIPPHSMLMYNVSKNKFNGEIPPQFCSMISPQILDLSHNNLTGVIPKCFGNLSKSLSILNLEENNFLGTIPDTWAIGSELKVIKLGHNNLQGKLPKSLVNCKILELLDLSNNQIKDTFPSWLGALPQLKIIILHFNGFYGAISGAESDLLFPNLQIIDISHNEFVGSLPMDYFKRWNVMANLDGKNLTYLHADYNIVVNIVAAPYHVLYSMTITNKGVIREYAKIFEIFSAIDLSCNKFTGEIPKVVGNLTRLQLLNLSNNILIGPIPPVLGFLKNLEALDLSHNKLTGRIPSQLTQLNFLGVFNVSYNYLTGAIPKGQQFNTFESSSFDGNVGLCGMPLSKKCDYSESKALPPSSTFEQDSRLLVEFGWKVVLLGYGCGFLVGVVIGIIVFSKRQEWFLKTFRVRQGRRRGIGTLSRRIRRR
ncbi:hypothetical protein SLEP1_g35773 [Rubroshorea leprosula]|uniref:Receptor-like protein 12 n=1 Tax=Rubroshorea leprosula TaxID=152421 RepID=A0AAV5KPS5_9ROSI|nr:hypothetical protein SLEP1_g35773 [Rubroshorea leprosula]